MQLLKAPSFTWQQCSYTQCGAKGDEIDEQVFIALPSDHQHASLADDQLTTENT